jgi:hypothetical protein
MPWENVWRMGSTAQAAVLDPFSDEWGLSAVVEPVDLRARPPSWQQSAA